MNRKTVSHNKTKAKQRQQIVAADGHASAAAELQRWRKNMT